MSEYSLKERLIARILSRFPVIKKKIKYIYVQLNYILNKKDYTYKIYPSIAEHKIKPCETSIAESFFGYYDKCPMNERGWIITHVSKENTRFNRKKNASIDIVLSNILTDEKIDVGSTKAFTWQQGSRSQWLDDDLMIYNDYSEENRRWVSKVYSISAGKIIKTFDYPVQDVYKNEFFLSINYKRLQKVTEDYGYNNEEIEEKNFQDSNDGLFLINYSTGEVNLIHSLEEIAGIGREIAASMTKAFHTINHVMTNKSGTKLMFIHRYYINGVRKDRLLVSDFKNLKIVADNDMVSHCCWFNDDTIYGYLRNNNKDGYYFIDLDKLSFSLNEEVDQLGLGDGHPHVHGDYIVFDTYPDRSRMQSLFLYDVKNRRVQKLLEVFQSPSYKESSRCDLHPRFSKNGDIVFFDSVFENKRRHYYIKLK